jgi:tellurite methyltransferase
MEKATSEEDPPRESMLLVQWRCLLDPGRIPGPVLDVACGDGRNGVYAARRGVEVICCDRSRPALRQARQAARRAGVKVRLWWTDLEAGSRTPFPKNAFGAVLVFRYLHRPLIPEIKQAVRPGGYVIYETFTVGQAKHGPPRNPAHLLQFGELKGFFADWDCLHSFEGELEHPPRAMAQIVARKI